MPGRLLLGDVHGMSGCVRARSVSTSENWGRALTVTSTSEISRAGASFSLGPRVLDIFRRARIVQGRVLTAA